ncbi:hypothetical protein CRYUN_Cryun11dG0028800 [Craigia yunnanensis]
MMRGWFSPLVCLLVFLCLDFKSTNGTDTILQGQTITHPKTIISSGGKFELGFFSPGNNSNYYLVIRYKVSKPAIVWVANREYPFSSGSSNLSINSEGQLVISNGRTLYISSRINNNTSATLLDSGNLVLQDRTSLEILWQSFDYPTNTILPGMSLGHDKMYEHIWSLVSWRSPEDPSSGSFSLELNSDGDLVVWQGSKPYWNGPLSEFENHRMYYNKSINKYDYVTWGSLDTSGITHMELDAFGQLMIRSWSEDDQSWYILKSSKCSLGRCGAFSVCNIMAVSGKPCSCLRGFKPLPSSSEHQASDQACVRKTNLQCNHSTGDHIQNNWFYQMKFVDFPSDTWSSLLEYENASYIIYPNWSSEYCESACLRDCSCKAYSFDYKLGCFAWFNDLFGLKQLATNDANGKNFYLKLHPSEFSKGEDLLKFDLAMSLKADDTELTEANMSSVRRKPEVQLPLFRFASVSAATDKFSATNKLGEGGFGPVYKGILLKGDEIAVKRLSKRSGQGWEELKNEALVIAKLQHKNLVRLLGCCIEKDEKILIYEYMPNKSLDFFLFDSVKRRILNWETRVRIIEGIAQGLLYLHQYSRLRIIHRDLKASNILLDNNMNPKISDFGMARIFGGDELQANTNRIVGTYGYMSPEYALEGLFSIKSDVFSFGVLLLEIVSGKKNTGYYQSQSLHLLGYAWDKWINNRGLELIDPLLKGVSMHLAMRFITIGLLCVQERADDRPTMSDVVPMLNNESMILLSPKQPAFLNVRTMANPHLVKSRPETYSVNDVTFSAFEAR